MRILSMLIHRDKSLEMLIQLEEWSKKETTHHMLPIPSLLELVAVDKRFT
jgi:hypothetical protein